MFYDRPKYKKWNGLTAHKPKFIPKKNKKTCKKQLFPFITDYNRNRPPYVRF